MSEANFTSCPDCQARLKVKSREVEGKKIRCPKCQSIFVVRLNAPSGAKPAPNSNTGAVPTTKKNESVSKKAPDSQKAPVAKKESAPARAAAPKTAALDETESSVVSWQNGIGDDTKYHIAHVSPAGITLALRMTEHGRWEELVSSVARSPEDAVEILQQQKKSVHLTPDQISKATYAQQLNQLILFDREGKKTKVPEGKEQAEIFEAIRLHLGGSESEEEADAWAVMQSPLFVLAVIGVIGGFFIWFTTICDPNYEASGRRSGMKALMNWVGYKIGPFWMSVAVGSLAALVLFSMIYQLIRRPVRQVLQFTSQEERP